MSQSFEAFKRQCWSVLTGLFRDVKATVENSEQPKNPVSNGEHLILKH